MNRSAIIGLIIGLLAPMTLMAELPVETAIAETITVPREIILDSTVEAVNQSTVSAQTGGQVKELFFDVDDFVEKNSIILNLRDTEQKAQLDRAEAALKEAQAELKRSQDEHARIKDIFAKKLVSTADMDRAAAALKTAEARVKAAKAGVEQAKEQMEYTQVRAPYSGIVTQRHVQVGEIASPGQPLMTGISLDRLRTLVAVPQSIVQAVRSQNKARVLLPEGKSATATKLTVFPFADHVSNTFKVRVDLPEGVPGLFPGMFVKTAFTLGEKTVLAIPEKSMVYRGEVSGVYIVKQDGRVGFRHIRPGRKLKQGLIAILAGLDEGEKVALDPIGAGVLLKQQAMENGHGE